MPKCSQCGESAAFHELTNYEIPATPDETTERLCFGCVRKELERVKAQNAAMRTALERADDIAPSGSGAEAIIRNALAIDAGHGYVPRAELEALKRDAVFSCFRCGDHNTPLYCLNCAHTIDHK